MAAICNAKSMDLLRSGYSISRPQFFLGQCWKLMLWGEEQWLLSSLGDPHPNSPSSLLRFEPLFHETYEKHGANTWSRGLVMRTSCAPEEEEEEGNLKLHCIGCIMLPMPSPKVKRGESFELHCRSEHMVILVARLPKKNLKALNVSIICRCQVHQFPVNG